MDISDGAIKAFQEHSHHSILNFFLLLSHQQFVQVLFAVGVEIDRCGGGIDGSAGMTFDGGICWIERCGFVKIVCIIGCMLQPFGFSLNLGTPNVQTGV
jgi:hypothetical protein